MTEVKDGIAYVIHNGIQWPPNLSSFLSYCLESSIDDAFTRMIKSNEPLTLAEKKARIECSHRCKKELPEDKARELFKKTLLKWNYRVKRDGLVESESEHSQNLIEYKPQPHKALGDAMVKGRTVSSLEARCLDLRRNKDDRT